MVVAVMPIGIEKSLETIEDLKQLVLRSVAFGKDPSPLILKISSMLEIGKLVSELVADAPASLPELKDIDSVEAGKLMAASYDAVNAILKSFK